MNQQTDQASAAPAVAADIFEAKPAQPVQVLQQAAAPQPAALAADNPAVWVQQAIQNKVDPTQLKMLMDLWKEYRAEVAKAAFHAAKAAFHAAGVVVRKDKRNDQYGSWYTTLGELVNKAGPELGRHGLSVDWDPDNESEPGCVVIAAVLTHSGGHSERRSIKLPYDQSGKKNDVQQIKSAITYGRAITYEAVLGLAATNEANTDDDGNGAGQRTGGGGGGGGAGGGASHDATGGLGQEEWSRLAEQGQEKASLGTQALTKWWGLLTERQRRALTPEFSGWKKAARAFDGDAAGTRP